MRYLKSLRVRDVVMVVLMSAIVAVLGVLGTAYVQGEGYYGLSVGDSLLYGGLGTLGFAVATLVIDAAYGLAIPRRRLAGQRRSTPHRIHRLLVRLTPRWSARSIAICALVMFVLWAPWIIVDFPDSLYYDTFYQIRQAYPEFHPTSTVPFDWRTTASTLTDAYFTDHHPILTTLLYAGFALASDALTGDWSLGIFAFVVLQAAATALFFAMAIAYLRRRGCPVPLCFALFVFFSIVPFYACWASTMMKDSLFSMVYIPYFILLAELVRTRGENLRRARTAVLFALLGVLLCLTKKTGLFVVVPTMIVAALMYRKHWLPLAGQALACLVVMQLVLPFLVFPLLNVAPGGKQEALSPLFQQTAKFYKDHYDDVTTSEWVTIGKIMPTSEIAGAYLAHTHDPVKFSVNADASMADYADYLRVWFAQGMRHPESYLSAVMAVGGGFFGFVGHTAVRMGDTDFGLDVGKYRNDTGSSRTLAETLSSGGSGAEGAGATGADAVAPRRDVAVQPESLAPARHAMTAAYDAISRAPGIIVLFTDATYLFWLPCIALFVAWRRRLPLKLLFVPFAITLFFCVIGPDAATRYALASIYTAPLLMGVLAASIRAGSPGSRRTVRARKHVNASTR